VCPLVKGGRFIITIKVDINLVFSMCGAWCLVFTSQVLKETLQMKDLRLKEVKCLVQGRIASKYNTCLPESKTTGCSLSFISSW
jgi:hypothetical protein